MVSSKPVRSYSWKFERQRRFGWVERLRRSVLSGNDHVGTAALGCPGGRSSPGFPRHFSQSEIRREFSRLPNPPVPGLLLDLTRTELRSADSRGRLSPHELCSGPEIHYGSSPNTATPFVVPTKTLPFTIIGVMY